MNARRTAQDDARRLMGGRLFLARVAGTSGGLIQIVRDGQSAPDDMHYPAAAGLAASVSPGDLVMCVVAGGTVVVLCGVVTT